MKRLLIPIACFFLVTIAPAQNLFDFEKEPGLSYSLPKTALRIKVELEKKTQKPGAFYMYSERYLATKDVVTEEKTSFVLKSIEIEPQAIADQDRTFLVPAKNKNSLRISVNEKGILCGLNVPANNIVSTGSANKKELVASSPKQQLIPLPEEYMLVSSKAKMAEGAAKQIYRIRESRLNLLFGDVEHLPNDGESFKVILKEMNRIEEELTTLFVGTSTIETELHIIDLAPSTPLKDNILFRISRLKGLVATNDLSGIPYYISVLPENFTAQKSKNLQSKKRLYSILPTSTTVTIGDGRSTLFTEKLLMPQFGQLVPIPNELLQRKDVKIYLDEETGRMTKAE